MKIGKDTGLYLGLAAKAFGATQLGDLALTAHNLKNKSGNGNGNGDKEKKSENTGPNDNGADTTPPTAPIGKHGTGDFDLNQNYWQQP